MKKPLKRRVRQNRWGNLRGYEGGRWVCEFSQNSTEAERAEWVNAPLRVLVTVRGGVAEVAYASPGVSVTVIDYDNDAHQ